MGVDAADIEVTNLNDSGPDSLRAAIENAVAGDRIVFNIPAGGTITMASDLPEVTDSLSFTNTNVAAVIIDRNGNGPLEVTGGVIDLGELQVTGVGADIVLSPAATLIGNIEQITAEVTASGTIAPGTSNATGVVGELLIDGALDATDSTIEVDVLGGTPASNDLIRVIGAAVVTDATLAPTFAGSAYAVGDTFTVIDATAGVTGPFANAADVFALPSNPFLEASINTLPNEVQLEIQDNNLTFESLYDGCNQQASSSELDRLRISGNAAQMGVITEIRNGSRESVDQAVGQLSGTIYPSLIDGEINQIHNQLQSMRDRVLMQRDSLIMNDRWFPWVRGYGMTLNTDADGCSTEGYRQQVAGLEIGTGFIGSTGLGAHAFAQLGSTDTDIRGLDQSADSDSYRFGGSLQYVGEVAYLMGTGGYGFQNHTVQRSMTSFAERASAASEFDGSDQFVSVELGTARASENSIWLSFVSLQGVRADLDSATESGGSDFDLSTQGIEADSLRSMVGCSWAQTRGTGLGPATTQVRLGWVHEFLDERQTAQTAIESAAPVFYDVHSADTGTDWLSVGTQLDWGFVLGGHFTVAYQGNLNTQSTFQSGYIGSRWNW